MKLMIINGPNLNMLGIREPDKYGSQSYEALIDKITGFCKAQKVYCECLQSNHEGDLLDWIQKAYFDGFDGIVINPGAYTHTSIALLDALKSVNVPAVEVHISDVNAREDFRQISYIRDYCDITITGHGTNGYIEALEYLIERYGDKK